MKLNFFTSTSCRTWLASVALMLGFVSTAVAQIPNLVHVYAEKVNATECDANNGILYVSGTGLLPGPVSFPDIFHPGLVTYEMTITRQGTGTLGSQITVPITPTCGVYPPAILPFVPTTVITQPNYIYPPVVTPVGPGNNMPVLLGLAAAQLPITALFPTPVSAVTASFIPNPITLCEFVSPPPGQPLYPYGTVNNPYGHPFPALNNTAGAPAAISGYKITGLRPGLYTIEVKQNYVGLLSTDILSIVPSIVPLGSQTVTVEIGVTPDAVSCIGGSPTSPGLNLTAAPAASGNGTGSGTASLGTGTGLNGNTQTTNGGQNCDTRLRASQLLINQCGVNIIDTAYTVVATTLGGTEIARGDHGVMWIPPSMIGKVFKASVTRHLYSENPNLPLGIVNSTCWGYVKLEDKTAPIIKACPANVTLACNEAQWANDIVGSSLINSLAQVGELSGPNSTSQSTNLATGVVNSVSPTADGTKIGAGTPVPASVITAANTARTAAITAAGVTRDAALTAANTARTAANKPASDARATAITTAGATRDAVIAANTPVGFPSPGRTPAQQAAVDAANTAYESAVTAANNTYTTATAANEVTFKNASDAAGAVYNAAVTAANIAFSSAILIGGSPSGDGTVQECSKWTQYYTDVVTAPGGGVATVCTGATITRTWWAKDEWGNTAMLFNGVPCVQIITVSAPPAGPPTITNLGTAVAPLERSCKVITAALETDILAGANPAGLNLAPGAGTLPCGYQLQFNNAMKLAGTCAGTYRIMRMYKLINICAGTISEITQNISVINTDPPTANATFDNYKRDNDGTYCWLMNGTMEMKSTKYKTVVKNEKIVFNNGTTQVFPLHSSTMCDAASFTNARFIQLAGTDNSCGATGASTLTYTTNDSRILTDAVTPGSNGVIVGGKVINKPGQPFMVNMVFKYGAWVPENPKFTVTATTACGVKISQTFEVMLIEVNDGGTLASYRTRSLDNSTPNTVCKEFTTATLDENGTVRIPLSAFENGSSDNCGIERQMVKRMTKSNSAACNTNSQIPTTDADCWNDYVDFNCEDVGADGNIMVALRSVDASEDISLSLAGTTPTTGAGVGPISTTGPKVSGNSSDCMIQVKVVDKTAPSCQNQGQINRLCTSLDLNNYSALFQTPTAFDNCSIKSTTFVDDKPLTIRCGAGDVTRTWTFTDCANQTVSCTQKLDVTTVHGFRARLLPDTTVTCAGIAPTAEMDRRRIAGSLQLLHNRAVTGLTGTYNTCSAPVVDVTETEYSNTIYCKVIERTYVIKNLCQLSNLSSSSAFPVDIFDLISGTVQTGVAQSIFTDGGDVIRFSRRITVEDKTAPTSTAPVVPIACVTTTCNFSYAVTLTGSDNCGADASGSTLVYSWRAVNNAGTQVGAGNTSAVSLAGLQFGKYTICYRVADLCGNMSPEYCFDIEAKDCKAPEVLVHNKIVELAGQTGVRTSGMARLNYIDIRNRITDNCVGDLTNSSKVTMEKGGVTTGSAPTATQGTSFVDFTCADLYPLNGTAVTSRNIEVRVWAQDTSGNWNYAISIITLQDNIGICNNSNNNATMSVSGGARTEGNSVVNNVAVSASVNGAVVATTNAVNSAFVLSVPASANVQVRAAKTNNEDAATGVTTFDIAKVSQHVLAIEQLATPYKQIAADVDKSGEIDATDMLHMRRFILKITPSLPGGNFRFVDKAYAFRNPANPFGEDFPEVVNFASLTANTTANFVAVKLGDVNDSYNGTVVRSARTLNFLANDMSVVAGNEYTVNISADKMDAAAFQGTFSFNGATVKSVKAGDLANMTEGNFGIFANAVTTSWNGKTQASADVLSITFVANKSGKLSEMLTINSALTQAIANDATGNEMTVNLKFNTGKVAGGEFALYQNQPNPVAGQTTIGFNLPTDGQARLTITAVDGKVVKVINGDYKAGFNSLTINKSDLNASGVFYYKLETADYSAAKKMVIIE